ARPHERNEQVVPLLETFAGSAQALSMGLALRGVHADEPHGLPFRPVPGSTLGESGNRGHGQYSPVDGAQLCGSSAILSSCAAADGASQSSRNHTSPPSSRAWTSNCPRSSETCRWAVGRCEEARRMSYSSSMRSTEHGSSSEPSPEAAMLSSASRENFASTRPASASPSSVSAFARYPCADGLRSAPGIHERI